MSDVPMPLPDDDLPLPDPFEADLVAYLDGELDPVASRKVEVRLATDSGARAKAAELKKTFDLLDYLPKPEPSPNFTTRTLERLPAINSPKPAATLATPAVRTQTQSKAATSSASAGVPTPRAGSQLSVPLPLASASSLADATVPLPYTSSQRAGFWAAGILIVVSACGGLGYFTAGLFRSNPPVNTPNPPRNELADSDHRVVEYLPLYAGVDDIAFVRELGSPELFGDDPTVAYDWKIPGLNAEKISGPSFEKLTEEFKALSPARQQALRELDKQMFAQEAPSRDRVFRVLETYAIWLQRLPETERKGLLALATPRHRLDEIRKIRSEQWIDALPAARRAEFRKLPADQQVTRILQWKEEEARRRQEWAFVRLHAGDILDNKAPWPFDSVAAQQEVIEFMRVSFRVDEDKDCRLTPTELDLYKKTLADAQKNGGWRPWGAYGKVSYDLTRKYERYLLPEPAFGKPITTYMQLQSHTGLAILFIKDDGPGRNATAKYVGRWPDFALAVHDFAMLRKGGKNNVAGLGPAKPSEFKEPLKSFILKELYPALDAFPSEKQMLTSDETHWPRYPLELVRLARQHDLSVPGMMLPGSPKQWDAIYNPGVIFSRPTVGPKP